MFLNLSDIIQDDYDLDLAIDRKNLNALSVSIEELKNVEELTDASLEGIGKFAKTITSRIVGITNSFAATIMRRKRSELTFFYQEKSSLVKSVEAADASRMIDIKVDIPTGMKGKYIAATSAILNTLKALDIDTVLKDAQHLIDSVVSSISKGSTGHEKLISDQIRLLTRKNKEIETLRKLTEKEFAPNAKSLEQKAFKAVFDSPTELKSIRLILEQQSETITMNNSRVESIHQIEATMDLIIHKIEEAGKEDESLSFAPTPKFMNSLSAYVGLTAYILDTYADQVVKQMAVEHNLVLVYKKLIETV